MEASTLWWLLAGLAVVAELLTGTFYLLMLALGLAAGALSAHVGAGQASQLAMAGAVALASVLLCHLLRKRRPASQACLASPDVNLDVGEIVQVLHWESDGTARVPYRGAQWTVVLRPGLIPAPGAYRVAELVGNRLLVDKA